MELGSSEGGALTHTSPVTGYFTHPSRMVEDFLLAQQQPNQ